MTKLQNNILNFKIYVNKNSSLFFIIIVCALLSVYINNISNNTLNTIQHNPINSFANIPESLKDYSVTKNIPFVKADDECGSLPPDYNNIIYMNVCTNGSCGTDGVCPSAGQICDVWTSNIGGLVCGGSQAPRGFINCKTCSLGCGGGSNAGGNSCNAAYKCSGSSCIRDDTNGTYVDSNCNGACTPNPSCGDGVVN